MLETLEFIIGILLGYIIHRIMTRMGLIQLIKEKVRFRLNCESIAMNKNKGNK